jgi:hypothetical protein
MLCFRNIDFSGKFSNFHSGNTALKYLLGQTLLFEIFRAFTQSLQINGWLCISNYAIISLFDTYPISINDKKTKQTNFMV